VPDDRTEAQRDADEKLEDAIRKCADAYGFLTDGHAVGDWLVYLELSPFDAGTTRYITLLPGTGVPWHRIYGLHVLAGKSLDDQREEDSE
jgi:hypothetical protein